MPVIQQVTGHQTLAGITPYFEVDADAVAAAIEEA
jgi:hypothetical protein